MLQGHIDMVCDKRAGVEHDFERDGIDLVVKDGILTANGTTLGADNGIAVALMLTVLDDDSLVHPALECVFTTDEETGLVGAETLDKSQIDARIMVNLDSEEEGVATVSCAGGVVATLTRPVVREHVDGATLTLDISGLQGGHSGSDIHLERGNGDLIMARIIEKLMRTGAPHLVNMNGGTKDNAINRECTAVLVYANVAEAEAAAKTAQAMIDDVTAELEVFDPGFTCTVEVADGASVEVIPDADARAFISALRLAPNGVMRRNVAADGSVEVSSNIGVVQTSDDMITFLLSPVRPSRRCRSYVEHSHVRDVFKESYRELFGTELRIESIHAGLECGLFAAALPGLDAIAVGPTLANVHTPDECMELASSERFYQLLVDALRRLAA